MAREQIITCDMGGEPDARPFEIIFDSVHVQVDLCEKHAAPLLKVAEKGRQISSAAHRQGGKKQYDRLLRGVSTSPDED